MFIVEIQTETGNPRLIRKIWFFLCNSLAHFSLLKIQFTKYLLAYCVQRHPNLCFPSCYHLQPSFFFKSGTTVVSLLYL